MGRTLLFLLLLALFAGLWWVGCQASDASMRPEGLGRLGDGAPPAPPPDTTTVEVVPREPDEVPSGPAVGDVSAAFPSSFPSEPALPRNLTGAAVRIVSEMVALSSLSNETRSPQVVLNVAHSRKTALSRSNEEWFANRLRVELNRAANGRILFIDPFLNDLEKRRNLKGADFRLEGYVSPAGAPESDVETSGVPLWEMTVRMVAPDSDEAFWSGSYEFQERL